jgi:hypothetical protein
LFKEIALIIGVIPETEGLTSPSPHKLPHPSVARSLLCSQFSI